MDKINYNELLPFYEEGKTIPKKIYQTNRTKEVPSFIKDNINYLKRINPLWSYKLYDDNDIELYIKKYYGEKIFNYYKRIDNQYGAAKADLFRYLLIYREGGVYLDLKSTMYESLDNVLNDNDSFILSNWDNKKGEPHEGFGKNYRELSHLENGEFMQWYIISTAGNYLLRRVIINVLKNIDNYSPIKHKVGQDSVFKITGPNVYTLSIEECILEGYKKYRIVNIFKDFKFKYSICEQGDFKILRHKNISKADYRVAWKPLIKNSNIFRLVFNFIYCKIYKLYIDLKK